MLKIVENVENWPNSCDVNTARFVKYVWPFFNIKYKGLNLIRFASATMYRDKILKNDEF